MKISKKFKINTVILVFLFSIGIFLIANKKINVDLAQNNKLNIELTQKHKYVNIDDLAYEAYASEEEYEPNIKKHMDIKVYNSSNICIHFKKDYGKPPLNIDFKFKEFNQEKKGDKIFVYMKYDANWIWPIENVEAGTRDNPVVFQVVEKDGQPYIEKKREFDCVADIPKDIEGFFNKIS